MFWIFNYYQATSLPLPTWRGFFLDSVGLLQSQLLLHQLSCWTQQLHCPVFPEIRKAYWWLAFSSLFNQQMFTNCSSLTFIPNTGMNILHSNSWNNFSTTSPSGASATFLQTIAHWTPFSCTHTLLFFFAISLNGNSFYHATRVTYEEEYYTSLLCISTRLFLSCTKYFDEISVILLKLNQKKNPLWSGVANKLWKLRVAETFTTFSKVFNWRWWQDLRQDSWIGI